MLADLLPEHRVSGVYHDAYHLELLEYFCRYAAENEYKPDVIILPINMRSFSNERVQRSEYQFVREKLFLSNRGLPFASFFRPLAVLRAFDLRPISEKEYLDIEDFDGSVRLGTFREIQNLDDDKQLHLRACYRYQLDDAHPHVEAMARIALSCQDAGIRLIVYSTPIDYERGDAAIGPGFSTGIRRNLAVVESTLAKYDLELLNLTFAFEKDSFAHDSHPDVYIRSAGKLFVAERLAETIRGVN